MYRGIVLFQRQNCPYMDDMTSIYNHVGWCIDGSVLYTEGRVVLYFYIGGFHCIYTAHVHVHSWFLYDKVYNKDLGQVL